MNELQTEKKISSARPRGRGDPGFAAKPGAFGKDWIPASAGTNGVCSSRESELIQSRRLLFTAVGLWTVCPLKICKRQKACRGDADRCLEERWHPLVPPETKALVHKVLVNEQNGMTPREALAAAEASMAAYRRQEEAFDGAAPKPFVPAEAQALPNGRTAKEPDSRAHERSALSRPPRHRGPRVRQL